VSKVKATENTRGERASLRLLYATIMQRASTHPDVLTRALDQLTRRLRSTPARLCERERIFLAVREKYTGPDPGLFSILLLNLITLQPGQGLFIPAGVPHAYLEGDIIECMTNSDNVVRAGLTSKYTDVSALLDVLTFEAGPLPILNGKKMGNETTYETPTPEFQVSRWVLPRSACERLVTGGKPEILLAVEGAVTIGWSEGRTRRHMLLAQGQSVVVPACLASYLVEAADDTELFRVTVPLC
jgi:mannose-6-phosphate isomerase